MDKDRKIRIFRDKFYGRQDIYGKPWTSTDQNGKVRKGYAPVCDNFWTDRCHIKLKDGLTCAQCEVKKIPPVTDKAVWDHISGEQAMLTYLVQDDGTVKFAALDFDMKEGKEHLGYKFEDVSVVSKFLVSLGIPHGIARSTSAGFHIYLFFSDFYSAARVRAFFLWLFERVGFMEQLRQGVRPLCEMFPKQAYANPTGPGNGIKTPMIEHRWAVERNGFVDANNTFIAPEDQWAYLESIPAVDVRLMDEIIEKHGLQVEEDTQTSSPGSHVRRALNGQHMGNGKWQQPLTGSYEKVVEGCAALRAVYAKAAGGQAPGHQEGFAAFHLAMSTADGIDYFKKHATGWGQTEKDWKQLEHSIGKNYSPWTCKKMQEHGVCKVGKKCFDKKPPVILVEGQYVHATDVPEAQWPDPSPIRFAFGKGDDFLEKLKREVDALSSEQDENEKGNKLREIAKRAQVFDEDQQRVLRDHIKAKKVIKAADLNKIFNKANQEKAEEVKEKANTRSDSALVGNNFYQLVEPYGYALFKKTKDGFDRTVVSSCNIKIEEERSYLDDDEIVKTVYLGTFTAQGYHRPFEIDIKKWASNADFTEFFSVLAGTKFNVLRTDVDLVKQAAVGFSEKDGVKRSNRLITQGWYKDTYLMPTVLVDKDGVRPNTEKHVDLSNKPHASSLEFKILAEDEVRDLVFHLKNDFLNAWPRKWTMTALAHALLPAVMGPLDIKKKPTLFFEGLTGSGKTELAHAIQHFWGEFDSLINLASTAKGMMTVAHDFKDVLCCFDDYKGLNPEQVASLARFIQYSYDPTTNVKLNRDSTLQKPKGTRGIVCFTGESFLSNDAAMVARCILVEVDKQDTRKTREKYGNVLKNRRSYNGITPHFIHWFLQQDHKAISADLFRLKAELYDVIADYQNADRLSYNLSLNHTLWILWVCFMHSLNVVTADEVTELIKEHRTYVTEIELDMVVRCADEQNGSAFLRVLLQLISSKAVIVQGFNDQDDGTGIKREVIGYVDTDNTGQAVLNLFPDIVCKVVKSSSRDNPIRGTDREFGRQFMHMGLLHNVDEKRFKRQVRWQGIRTYVWCFDMAKLGLHKDGLTVIEGGKDKNAVSTADNSKVASHNLAVMKSDGTF